MKDEIRAVVEAARSYRPKMSGLGNVFDAEGSALMAAVDALETALSKEEPNKPTGFVLPRPWELVPVGWFVRTPDLKWYEVIGTKLEGGNQHVTLKAPDGRTGTFPRDPKAEVKVRRGTQTNRLSDAIEALSDTFGGTSIVKDDPPWDE